VPRAARSGAPTGPPGPGPPGLSGRRAGHAGRSPRDRGRRVDDDDVGVCVPSQLAAGADVQQL